MSAVWREARHRAGHAALALAGAVAVGAAYVHGLDWALRYELARAERELPVPAYLLAKAAPRDGPPLEVAAREYDALLEWQASARIALLLLLHDLESDSARRAVARRLDADMERVDLGRKSAEWLETVATHYEARGKDADAATLRRLAAERGAVPPAVLGMPQPPEHLRFEREIERSRREGEAAAGREDDRDRP